MKLPPCRVALAAPRKYVLATSKNIRSDLLSHRDARIRLAAAVSLVQKKEIKSIPVLLGAILGNAGNRKIDAAGPGGLDPDSLVFFFDGD